MDGSTAQLVSFGQVAAIEGSRARVVLDMAEDGSGFPGAVPPQIGHVVSVNVTGRGSSASSSDCAHRPPNRRSSVRRTRSWTST